MRLLDPVADVQVVDVLLGDVVAADPRVVIRIAQLVGHLGHPRFASGTHAVAGAVPVRPLINHLADLAVVNAFDRFLVQGVVVPLQAHADFHVLLLGDLGRRQHAADAWRVDRHGLLHEHVLALLGCVLKMDRPEVGRGRQDHHVDTAVDGLSVGVETDKPPFGRHFDLAGQSLVRRPVVLGVLAGTQRAQTGVQLVREQVGHRPQCHGPRCRQGLGRRAGPAAAAADQGDLQRVAAGRVDVAGKRQRGRSQHGAGPVDEGPACQWSRLDVLLRTTHRSVNLRTVATV